MKQLNASMDRIKNSEVESLIHPEKSSGVKRVGTDKHKKPPILDTIQTFIALFLVGKVWMYYDGFLKVCWIFKTKVCIMSGLFFGHFSKKLKENKLKESYKLNQFFKKKPQV